MEAVFERGDPSAPKGHALLYFRDQRDAEQVWATYIVVPPVAMDLGKYMPPMFAAQLSGQVVTSPAAYPIPPVPERVESHVYLLRLAETRGDDLLDAGRLDPSDLQRTLLLVAEAGQRYAHRYEEYLAGLPKCSAEPELAADLDVDDLLLQVATAAELVEKLATLAGRLRYAIEGGDAAMTTEVRLEMEGVARYLDDKFRPREIVEAASQPDQHGARLAQLLLERAYRMAAEDYAALPELDSRIQQLQRAEP